MRILSSSLQSARLLFPVHIQTQGVDSRRREDSARQTTLIFPHAYLRGQRRSDGMCRAESHCFYLPDRCAEARYVQCSLLPAVEERSRVYFVRLLLAVQSDAGLVAV